MDPPFLWMENPRRASITSEEPVRCRLLDEAPSKTWRIFATQGGMLCMTDLKVGLASGFLRTRDPRHGGAHGPW
jgi:hypothetical protein